MSYRSKKRFGQHFLHDPVVIGKIIAAAQLKSSEETVEIGPGLGVLTDELLSRSSRVHVIEIDRDLLARLEARREPNLVIHAGDVLKLPWRKCLPAPPYTLVANLPYNISSQVVFRLLEHRDMFQRQVLMFQREVGERLMADPGGKDYGILSVLCQLWYQMDMVCLVKPGAFNPPPKVYSIVISFVPLERPRVDPIAPELFLRVVKAAFTQRRKTLRNSLLAGSFSAEQVDAALCSSAIDPRRRGETLSLEEFSSLTKAFFADN